VHAGQLSKHMLRLVGTCEGTWPRSPGSGPRRAVVRTSIRGSHGGRLKSPPKGAPSARANHPQRGQRTSHTQALGHVSRKIGPPQCTQHRSVGMAAARRAPLGVVMGDLLGVKLPVATVTGWRSPLEGVPGDTLCGSVGRKGRGGLTTRFARGCVGSSELSPRRAAARRERPKDL
jgi:hypothetical protein